MSLPKVRRLCALLFAVVLAFSFQLVAYAAHNRYDDDDYSITLDAHYREDDGFIYFLAGDTYELTLIAHKSIDDDTLDVTYNIVDTYRDYDCDWPTTSASERLAIAKELAKVAVPDETGVTNKYGKLTFSNLKPGLYLVARTQVAPANQEYIIDPYLVTLPIIEDGEVFKDIEVDEKFAHIDRPRPSPTPSARPTPESSPVPTPTVTPETPKAKLPQTGQLNWPIPVLIAMGLSLILLGGWLQRKSDHEK